MRNYIKRHGLKITCSRKKKLISNKMQKETERRRNEEEYGIERKRLMRRG
jgi:hypothetical protein